MNKTNKNIFEVKAKFGNNPDSLLELAAKNFNENNLYKARFYIETLLKEYPAKAEYYSALGTVYKKLDNLEQAKKSYSEAIRLDPGFYEAYFNIGLIFCIEGNTDAEINSYLKAIQINPELYIAYYNIGNAYRKLDQFDKAEIYYKQAILIKKDFDDALFNLGVIYERTGRYQEGLDCYERVVGLKPDHASTLWNKALLNLKLGKFETGWKEYEIRKTLKSLNTKNITNKLLVDQDVSGKRVLVYSEQGLGDNIQFIRYLKLLKAKGAYVIFECNPKLFYLFENYEYFDEIILQTKEIEPDVQYDYQSALLSLPGYFRTDINTIPGTTPYLFPDEVRTLEWKKLIGDRGKLKIGLAWTGASNNLFGKNRSCAIEDLFPLLTIKDAEFYSLQKTESEKIETSKYLPIKCFDNIDSIPFLDTAALIKNMDLVISIDTSIAHLAGAIGKETWIMLPFYADWRWLINRNNSPWYPTARLFRQKYNGNWESVVAELRDRLNQKLTLRNFPVDYKLN